MTLNDPQYYEFMNKLITQGLLRMMEKHVSVECRAQDRERMPQLFKDCEQSFSSIFSRETGKDLSACLTLSEYSLEDKYKHIIGGVFMRSNDGLIVCDNSIDARVNLIFEQLLPEIRGMLFPRK